VFALDDPDVLVLAGTIDGAVVGYARVHAEALPGDRELAVLTDVFVDAGAREVGVGALLLDAAVDWARRRGAVGIDSLALPGMRATKNFFEAAGLVARAIVVHKALP
jgi:GNAT superfamily N-acetyltransferase